MLQLPGGQDGKSEWDLGGLLGSITGNKGGKGGKKGRGLDFSSTLGMMGVGGGRKNKMGGGLDLGAGGGDKASVDAKGTKYTTPTQV